MKKNKILLTSIFIVVISGIMISCGDKFHSNKNSEVSANTKDTEVITSTEDEEQNKTDDTLIVAKEGSSGVSKITIPYPTFQNIKNKDKVNKLIQDYIKNLEAIYEFSENLSQNINYKIMFQDDKYISIYFYGDLDASTSAYPSKFKSTLNIDIEKASIIKLEQIVNIDDKFISVFKNELESEFKSMGVNVSDVFDVDNLKNLLQQADKSGEYIWDVQSYFTDNEVVIILSVPHAIGDYIEVNIPKVSIGNNIK